MAKRSKSKGSPSAGAGRKEALQALRVEVFQHLFAATAEEMGAALLRSSFSPNVKERRDFSCALFDAQGRMVSQAAHIPVHLGAAPLGVQAVLESCELSPGDAVVVNDPYRGGTHLPDISLVTPVFLEPSSSKAGGRTTRSRRSSGPDFLVANRAHHADVGGPTPGSMGPARDVHGEGLRIPPVHLVRSGVVQSEVLSLLLANMRVPREREGDLLAQWAANRLGEQRLGELASEHGIAELGSRAAGLIERTAEGTRAWIRRLPGGAVEFEDRVELTGAEDARIHVRLERRGGRLGVDFRGCSDQVEVGVNAPRAVAVSAVLYTLRLLLPEGTPTNDGVLAPVEILTRPGSIVDARYPAPVAAGNVETSQRLVDVLLGALAQWLPDRIPAASAGTMSNLTFGGPEPEGPGNFSYYETIAGGSGASPVGPGERGIQTHMTNTRNTPIEALEAELPVRILACGLRRGSGGDGTHRGGEGLHKVLRFLTPVRASWVADRQRLGPWGLAGGGAGSVGSAGVRRAARGGVRKSLSGSASLDLEVGDELHLQTPGGGGWGAAAPGGGGQESKADRTAD